MATHYVNSAAAGANNGTSKTDAWTSLASATGVAAGDVIWISHTHNQNPGASATYLFTNGTAANPVVLVSVNFSTDAYTPAPSAQFSGAASDITLTGHVRVFGLSIGVADDTTLGGTGTTFNQHFESVTFNCGDDLSVMLGNSVAEFRGCAFTFAAGTAWSLITGDDGVAHFRNCTWSGSVGTNSVGGEGGEVVFEDCDLSLFTSLFATIASGWRVVLRRCAIHASLDFASTLSGSDSEGIMEGCDDGTITVPTLGLTKYANFYGTVSATLARYRTGGADDGLNANAYSWEMATNANAVEMYGALRSPPLTRWAEPDASISSATARGIFTSTRMAPLGTPAALTTDGDSTWNGTNVGTKQKVSVTLTNGDTLTVYVASAGTLNNDDFWIEVSEPDQVGGPVSVRCFLAKPSTTVYVDPRIDIA